MLTFMRKNVVTMICIRCCVKVFRGDAADQIFQAQEFESRLHHAGSDMDHLRSHLYGDNITLALTWIISVATSMATTSRWL